MYPLRTSHAFHPRALPLANLLHFSLNSKKLKIFEDIQDSFETIITKIIMDSNLIMDLNCTETADLSFKNSFAECKRLSNESDDDDDYKTKIRRKQKTLLNRNK